MSFGFPRLVAASLVCFGCGSGSPGAPPSDGGSGEGEAASSGDDGGGGSCFPTCPGEGGIDGSGGPPSTCAQLATKVETLETLAQACNPERPNQCAMATSGPCCGVTVNGDDPQSITDFGNAVMDYLSQCDAGCPGQQCPSVPSNQCVSSGSTPTIGQCAP